MLLKSFFVYHKQFPVTVAYAVTVRGYPLTVLLLIYQIMYSVLEWHMLPCPGYALWKDFISQPLILDQ